MLTGASSSTATSRRTGWLFAPLLGWYDFLLPRHLVSPFTMALHVVKVYVMGACSRHVWAVEVIGEGEGGQEEGGRNGFDEHQDYKTKYKGTGSPKSQQIRKNDTKSP